MAGLRRGGFKVSGGKIRQELTGFLQLTGCTKMLLEQTACMSSGSVSNIMNSPQKDVSIDTVVDLRRAMRTIRLQKAG